MPLKIACSGTLGHRVSFEEALELIAGLGFRFADLLLIAGWAHISPAELAADPAKVHARIRSALDATGLKTATISTGVGVPPIDRSARANDTRKRETAALLELARRLGARVMVIQPGGAVRDRPWNDAFDKASASFAEQAALAREAGVIPAIELHRDSPFETIQQGRRLLARVPDLKLVLDPSHQVSQGVDTRDLGWVLDNAVHIHLRDARPGKMQEEFGRGTVDFGWVLAGLRERRYSGYVAIEYLVNEEFDAIASTRKLKELLEEEIQGAIHAGALVPARSGRLQRRRWSDTGRRMK